MWTEIIAVGPHEKSWFMHSNTQWTRQSLPHNLEARFASPTNIAVSHVWTLVLGAGDSYFISYKGKDGRNYILQHGIPATLVNWLFQKDHKGGLVRRIEHLKVALGPNNSSFWATDGVGSVWWNLPASLMGAINSLLKPNGSWHDKPRILSLGVNDTYVLKTERNGIFWNFGEFYPQLNDEMHKLNRQYSLIHHLYLCPHPPASANAPNSFVLTLTSGGSAGALPEASRPGAQKVLDTIFYRPPAARQVQQHRSNGSTAGQLALTIGGAVLKGVINGVILGEVADLAGAGNIQPNFSSGGGGGGGGGFSPAAFDMNPSGGDFWGPISDAASDPIQ